MVYGIIDDEKEFKETFVVIYEDKMICFGVIPLKPLLIQTDYKKRIQFRVSCKYDEWRIHSGQFF